MEDRPLAVAARSFRLVALVLSGSPASRAPRRQPRATLGWFAAAVLFAQAAAVVAMDAAWPRLRDPEYGRRASALRERVREHPGRPLVVVVGNSRVAMGVKPDAWEAARPGTPRDPLLFNVGVAGSGPVTQLLTVRRLYSDGLRPAVVLLEYWPPVMRQDGEFADAHRFDARRLRRGDWPVVRDYFPDPGAAGRRMWASRLNALGENGPGLALQADPELAPRRARADAGWADLDGWGWLPGMDPDDDATRRKLTEHQKREAVRRFRGHAIHPDADQALREAAAVARARGAQVGFLFMPESSEFQSWYPPKVEAAGRAHLAALARDLGALVIHARDWVADRDLADGFHLSRAAAGPFTARLGSSVAATFPTGAQR